MGHHLVDWDDGCWIVDIIARRQSYFVLAWSFSIQRWLQRVLQRFIAYVIWSNELNFSCLNSDGAGNRLGFGPNNNCFYLHMGFKLAPDFPVHFDPFDYSHLLCAHLYTLITSFFSSQAPILIGEESDRTDCNYKLKQTQPIRPQRVVGLQRENIRLQ